MEGEEGLDWGGVRLVLGAERGGIESKSGFYLTGMQVKSRGVLGKRLKILILRSPS